MVDQVKLGRFAYRPQSFLRNSFVTEPLWLWEARGRGFESRNRILDGHFFHILLKKCLFETTAKETIKEPGMAHFLVTQLLCGHQSNIRLASGFENIYKNRNSNLTAKFAKM